MALNIKNPEVVRLANLLEGVHRDLVMLCCEGDRRPAALNFGDCLTYAVARLSGLALLYTGNDFARTDLAE